MSIISPQQTSNIFVKKCSYFLAIIKRDKFIRLGAKQNTNFYVIPKKYDGTSTGETCALIGLNKHDIINLIYNTDKVLPILTSLIELQHIDSIDRLSIKLIENTVKYFSKYIVNLNEDDLLLFNIEPKGQTKRQLRFYPNPNMSIPGGNMEECDNLCIEKCGEREFREETGINITGNYDIIARNKLPLLKMYSNDIQGAIDNENKQRIDEFTVDNTDFKFEPDINYLSINQYNAFNNTEYNRHKKHYSISFPNYSSFRKMSERVKKVTKIEKYFFLIRIFPED